jgi:hypothetical protein
MACVVEPTCRAGTVQTPAGVIGALTRQLSRATRGPWGPTYPTGADAELMAALVG